jgi:hypothetical protein
MAIDNLLHAIGISGGVIPPGGGAMSSSSLKSNI